MFRFNFTWYTTTTAENWDLVEGGGDLAESIKRILGCISRWLSNLKIKNLDLQNGSWKQERPEPWGKEKEDDGDLLWDERCLPPQRPREDSSLVEGLHPDEREGRGDQLGGQREDWHQHLLLGFSQVQFYSYLDIWWSKVHVHFSWEELSLVLISICLFSGQQSKPGKKGKAGEGDRREG